ncbi:MAG: hypothetical protein JJU46_12230, partial [Balneolaceae bacterium]|nr:hypothetical protein [Balneolaceae bacterium]
LSSKDEKNMRRALLFNGFCRFPTVLLYCVMGLLIGTLVVMTPGLLEAIPEGQADYMVPVFIVEYLPNGLIGLLVAAILAAAMSSLDSALNSLSAATVQDFVLPNRKDPVSSAEQFRLSKRYTVVWGVICVILAFSAGNIAPTVIEAINKIGSLFYGPIIATFALAMLTKSVNARDVNYGIFAGVLFNLLLWIFAEGLIFWFWWNATGFAVTTAVALLLNKMGTGEEEKGRIKVAPPTSYYIKESTLLFLYFAGILLFSISIAWWL